MNMDEREWMAGAPPRELWNRLNRECHMGTLPGYLAEHAEVRPVKVPTWPPRQGTRTAWEVWVDGKHVIPAEHDHIYIYRKGGDAERFDGGYCAEICDALYRVIAEAEAEGRGPGYVKVPGFIPVGAGDRALDSSELARMTAFPDDRHSELHKGFREWVDGKFTPYRMLLMALGEEEPAEAMLELYIDHLAEAGDEEALFRQFGVRMIMVDTVKEG